MPIKTIPFCKAPSACGTALLLFLLNLPMGGMILPTVRIDSGFPYPERIIWASVLYALYVFPSAVRFISVS